MTQRAVLTVLIWAVIISCIPSTLCSRHSGPFRAMFAPNPPKFALQNGVDPGQPLFLTPYIEKGEIQEGQQLSLVGQLNGTNVKSYSGFLTVNKNFNSNIFFWFFPSQYDPTSAPVLLWLQGGPGGSSLFGLFVEHGPFSVTKDLKLLPRNYTWTSNFSVLYIDNPVGAGFSFTGSDQGYSNNETAVAENLYNALVQFFELFPQYQKNDFYATGESYAGKYVPALAYHIHFANPTAKVKINLKGMAIGDGFSAPDKMVPSYGDFMFQTGLADSLQKNMIDKYTSDIVRLIQEKQWEAASKALAELINGSPGNYFVKITGCSDYFNFLRTTSPPDMGYYHNYLALPEVRKAIHVGNLTFHNGDNAADHLYADMLKSVEQELTFLVNEGYKILMYSGQLDIIVAATLTEAFLQQLEWVGAPKYATADRLIWKIVGDTEVAGYVRQVLNLQQVIVRGGGHILPYDQPRRAFDMIDRFITGRPFHLK